MFKRKKVQPTVNEYVARRYEDTAVCIFQDLHGTRGLRNLYVPWLEEMLFYFPPSYKERHSLVSSSSRVVWNAWKEQPATSAASRGRDDADSLAVSAGARNSGTSHHPEERVSEARGESEEARGRRKRGEADIQSSRFCVIL